MRSFWSGTISFGLINIPVKLYAATHENGLRESLERERRTRREHAKAA